MFLYIYAIYDEKREEFTALFHFASQADAIRYFKYTLSSDPVLFDSRADYELHLLGSFNKQTAEYRSDKSIVLSGATVTLPKINIDE